MMQDDEDRDMTPAERAAWDADAIVRRRSEGKCTRWGAGPDACVLPLEHVGPDRDAQGNTTLSLTRQILGR